MTLGRTKSVDILASDPRNGKFYQIEVKTNLDSRKKDKDTASKLFGRIVGGWIMNEKHESIVRPNLWYCFVMIGLETKNARFFIVPSKVVADYVRAQHKLWLAEEGKSHPDISMRMFRIGRKGEAYKVTTPAVEDYEDNWQFHESQPD